MCQFLKYKLCDVVLLTMFANQFAKRKSVVPTATLFELTSVLLEYTLALLRVHSDKTSDNINLISM